MRRLSLWMVTLGLVVCVLAVTSGPAAAQADRDCADFVYQEDAQAYLLPGDPYRLDDDGDGLACESLPRRPASPTPTPPSGFPPCDPAGLPAVRIVGLPSRAVIGPEHPFGLEDTFAGDAVVVGDLVRVEMRGEAGDVFFTGRTRQRDDELFFVWLDPEDRGDPVTISARFTEQKIDGTRCERVVEKQVTGYVRLYFPARCYGGSYRPRSVIVFCADAGMVLRQTKWRGWNRSIATGRAVALTKTCKPDCATGGFVNYHVAVRVYRVRQCESTGRYQYTRLRVSFLGRKWPSGPRKFVQRFDCNDAE